MPSVRRIPDNRRRSRTGCLNCRKRRRKCDEGKPSCQNCSTRSVTCRYGDLTFVFDGPQRRLTNGDASQVDVDDDSQTAAAASPLMATVDIGNYHQTEDIDASLNHVQEPSTPQSIASTATTVVAPRQGVFDSDLSTAWTANDFRDDMTYAELTPRHPIDERSCQRHSLNNLHALLHFRYQMVPWIESNSCKSIFGPAIMTLARDRKIMSECISVCVSMKDKSLDLETTTSAGLFIPPRLLERLAREDAFTADVGSALLSIGSVFYTPPSEWANIASVCEAHLPESVLSSAGFELTPEPLKSLLRLQLKVDLAASIVSNKPPSANLIIPSIDVMLSDIDDPLASYDGCLSCLTLSLRLIHFELIPMLSGFHESSLQPVASHVSRWDRWFELWSRCMSWFQDRPRKMKPVLESSDEVSHPEQPFPVDVYTSATSLQANLTMHISAVVLLSQKPRLTNATSTFQRLGSRSWHIQKMARMLVGNHFKEQWDPIVIAALLFIAREMSHSSQQEALLSCFDEISSATQIPVAEEIGNLRARWQSIQQDNPPKLSHRIHGT